MGGLTSQSTTFMLPQEVNVPINENAPENGSAGKQRSIFFPFGHTHTHTDWAFCICVLVISSGVSLHVTAVSVA